ncbi:MAG: secretin N-terminal domain-containing protein [bacterium]
MSKITALNTRLSKNKDGIKAMTQPMKTTRRPETALLRNIWAVAILLLPILLADGQAAPPGQGGGGGGTGLNRRIPGPMVAQQTDLNQILTLLGAESGLRFSVDQGISPKVTFSLTDPTVKEVLDTVLPGQGLDYLIDENGAIRIGQAAIIQVAKQGPEQLVSQTFVPFYVSIEVLKEPLSAAKTDMGQLIFEPDSNRVYAVDTPEAIAEMEKILAELDSETETRVFQIEHGDVASIAEQLQGVINTEEGELVIDDRNSILIITDTIERLDRAEAIIEQLDKDLEIRVFPLKFTDEYNIDVVIGLLEPLLSEAGTIDYDLRTMRIIVQDTPSRLDKMAKLIEQLDIPTLQVYMEVDIVQVNDMHELSLGTEMAIGRDSAGAAIEGSTAALFSLDPFASIGASGITFTDISDGRYKLEIEAMVRKNKAQVIASPRLLVSDDQPAYFNLGAEEPYMTRQRGYGGYGGGGYGGTGYTTGYNSGDYYTQRSRPVGTILDIIPHISEAGYIDMEISVEDSSADRVDLGGQQGLRVHQTLIETRVTVKDRRTVVLGGVINRKLTDNKSGVPFLRKVPVLGAVFGKTETADSKTKLLIFITPIIVNIDDPYDFAFVENTERIKKLREGGAFDFLESDVDQSLLDWSDELPNEQKEVIFDKRPSPKKPEADQGPTSVLPPNLRERGYTIVGEEDSPEEAP